MFYCSRNDTRFIQHINQTGNLECLRQSWTFKSNLFYGLITSTSIKNKLLHFLCALHCGNNDVRLISMIFHILPVSLFQQLLGQTLVKTWWHCGPLPMCDVTMLLYLVQMMICAFVFSGTLKLHFFPFKICLTCLYYTKRLTNIEGKQWNNQILPPQFVFLFCSRQQTTGSHLSVWYRKIPLRCWIQ